MLKSVAGLCFCLAALTAVVVGSQTPAAAQAATLQRTYEPPFDEAGAPAIDTTTRTGDNCTGSFINGQLTAYRCFSGHFIYDPCFLSPSEDGSVLCVESPWATTGVRLTGAALEYPPTRTRKVIWAIQLANGSRCVYASGAGSVRGQRRLNYYCTGHVKRYLWGLPNRNHATWTILMSHGYTGRGWKRVKVAVVWS